MWLICQITIEISCSGYKLHSSCAGYGISVRQMWRKGGRGPHQPVLRCALISFLAAHLVGPALIEIEDKFNQRIIPPLCGRNEARRFLSGILIPADFQRIEFVLNRLPLAAPRFIGLNVQGGLTFWPFSRYADTNVHSWAFQQQAVLVSKYEKHLWEIKCSVLLWHYCHFSWCH